MRKFFLQTNDGTKLLFVSKDSESMDTVTADVGKAKSFGNIFAAKNYLKEIDRESKYCTVYLCLNIGSNKQ